MYLLYLIALIPLAVGLILFFLFNKKIVWIEWLLSASVSFIIAGIFHASAIFGMTHDIETWSGEIIKATFYPEWVERYTTVEVETDSDGNVTTHTEVHYQTHEQYWEIESNIDTKYEIEQDRYNQIVQLFGGVIETEDGNKDGFYSGDPNIYPTYNKTGYIIPITDTRKWSNKIKCAPSLFSFAKVPADIDSKLFNWPENKDPFNSDRVFGTASNIIGTNDWDKMNAKLGPNKKVNLILCGYYNMDSTIADWQRSKWIGGKKNDLVICYGCTEKPDKAVWAKVFGWTEKEDVKRNLETLFLTNPIDKNILPLIEKEVYKNYQKKDWKKFDYISIEPTMTIIVSMVIIMIIVQTIFYLWAYYNEIESFEDFVEFLDNIKERFNGRRYY